jgi:hypothetical protein
MDLAADNLSATSLPLPDGDGYYFHIRAKDGAGNWANGAAHLGPIRIDASPPQNPAEVSCLSHQTMVWSSDNTPEITWSEADGSISGPEGYGFLWDHVYGTIPGPVLNVSAEVLRVSSPPLPDGEEWYFHLRTRDNAGNWAPGTVHLGPYFIDATAPAILNFSLNGGAEFSSCRTARAILRAEDAPGGSGLSGIRHRSTGDDWSEWANYTGSFFVDLTGSDQQWTVEAQVRDAANNTSPISSASLLLDTVPPVVSQIRINAGEDFTNSTSAVLSISADDPAPSSAVESMSFCTDGRTWSPWERFNLTRQFNLTPGDGTKTVSVRMRDRAGNIGPPANDTIVLDTTPPVTFIPMLPATVDDWNFTVAWTGADEHGGVASFDVQYRDESGPWTDWLLATTLNTASFTGQDGHNYSFRARARDRVGNLEAYPASARYPVRIDIPRPVVSITRPASGSTVSGQLEIRGASSHPKAGLSVQLVQLRIDNGSWRNAKGTSSWSFALDSGRLGDGRHTISVRAFDGTKYSSEETRKFEIRNETGLSGWAIPLSILVVALLAAVSIVAVLANRKKRRGTKAAVRPPASPAGPAPTMPPETALPPESQLAPVPPDSPVAPISTPPARPAVVGKVSVDDLDEETVPLPAGMQRAPAPEPAPYDRTQAEADDPLSEVPIVPAPRSETAKREANVLKALSSLPRGLPSSLWGMDLEDLASRVVSGERKDGLNGEPLVKIGNRWYHGDETDLGLFMQEYKK